MMIAVRLPTKSTIKPRKNKSNLHWYTELYMTWKNYTVLSLIEVSVYTTVYCYKLKNLSSQVYIPVHVDWYQQHNAEENPAIVVA